MKSLSLARHILSRILLVSITCAGCKPASTTTPVQTEAAAKAPASAPVAAAPSTPKAEQPNARPAAPAPAAPITPRPHRELLALIDFSQFPKVPGASREDSYPTMVGFSIPKKDATTLNQARETLATFLTSRGWSIVEEKDSSWDQIGGISFYEKDGARISSSAGISKGHPTGEDVNAGLFLIGDVDARSLPMYPGSKVTRSSFSSAAYISPTDLISVRKFNQTQLPALGWKEYSEYIVGYQPAMEEIEADQRFVQNGVSLGYRLTRKGNETEVSVSISVLERSLPIPPAPDMLKLRDDPPLMTCFVKIPADQALAWAQETLGKEGWTSTPAAAAEEGTTRHAFKHPSFRKPLIFETLPSDTGCIVQLRE